MVKPAGLEWREEETMVGRIALGLVTTVDMKLSFSEKYVAFLGDDDSLVSSSKGVLENVGRTAGECVTTPAFVVIVAKSKDGTRRGGEDENEIGVPVRFVASFCCCCCCRVARNGEGFVISCRGGGGGKGNCPNCFRVLPKYLLQREEYEPEDREGRNGRKVPARGIFKDDVILQLSFCLVLRIEVRL